MSASTARVPEASRGELAAAAARADLCRLVAACYYEPAPEFAEEGVFDSMLQAAAGVDADLAPHVRAMARAFESAGPEALLPEYARLFLGPVETLAPPYESAWREDVAPGAAAASLERLHASAGLEIDPGLKDLPDHVACEMELLYLLIFREGEALARGDGQALAEAAALRARLVRDHLGAWIPDFTAAVASAARDPFYRELAVLTAKLLAVEAIEGQSRGTSWNRGLSP